MKSTALKESASPRTLAADPARQAFLLLRTVFAVAPILFGLDKFTNLLTDWTGYLAPMVPDTLHLPAQTVMYAVGVIEIIAGILVALRPRIGSLVVAAWLLGIIVNLLVLGAYYDVALRDFGLFVGALALNRLATATAAHQPGGTTVSH
ncbi:UNVERIFIED_ORG: putative membrane protein YphA (DoxX/SURF4 family) [Arthrobacter globiformis]|nr:putative membrane protein YphA (DoxX/SURF4 family) [Arthrobacter globiformis]